MTDEQIKHMVNRFLAWKLPRDTFNPDCGISFDKKPFNTHTDHPSLHEPSGTNLFDAQQAEAMIRHMLDGMPGKAAEFVRQEHGAIVATIHETPDGCLEVMDLGEGRYDLIVHQRVSDADRFDDVSIRLKTEHFKTLGTIAVRSVG